MLRRAKRPPKSWCRTSCARAGSGQRVWPDDMDSRPFFEAFSGPCWRASVARPLGVLGSSAERSRTTSPIPTTRRTTSSDAGASSLDSTKCSPAIPKIEALYQAIAEGHEKRGLLARLDGRSRERRAQEDESPPRRGRPHVRRRIMNRKPPIDEAAAEERLRALLDALDDEPPSADEAKAHRRCARRRHPLARGACPRADCRRRGATARQSRSAARRLRACPHPREAPGSRADPPAQRTARAHPGAARARQRSLGRGALPEAQQANDEELAELATALRELLDEDEVN